ncbi:MAG: hypothetical protein J2P48_15865 [Alphaproteobacteria bacterium]|nr:hypothetical protein [Alphaproteobacteria bacterium]
MAYEIAVVVADVTDEMRDVQSSPLLTATTGSAAQGVEDRSLHPGYPGSFRDRSLAGGRGAAAEEARRTSAAAANSRTIVFI